MPITIYVQYLIYVYVSRLIYEPFSNMKWNALFVGERLATSIINKIQTLTFNHIANNVIFFWKKHKDRICVSVYKKVLTIIRCTSCSKKSTYGLSKPNIEHITLDSDMSKLSEQTVPQVPLRWISSLPSFL